MKRIATLIPAAGAATRFGQCKQLMTVNGKSLLQHAVDRANTLATNTVFVVTGAEHPQISATIRQAMLIHNPRWSEGLGGSIACGMKTIAGDYDGILIMLADQVALHRDDLQRLRDGFDGANIVCARYRGQRGVPALFCRESYPELQRLAGDRGAKSLLHDARFTVTEVAMENAALDIDTEEDLNRWLQKSPG